MLPPALVNPLDFGDSLFGSLRFGLGAEHKVGFGSVSVVDAITCFDGDLGRGTCSFFERELFFAWFLLGITCLGVLAPVVVAL